MRFEIIAVLKDLCLGNLYDLGVRKDFGNANPKSRLWKFICLFQVDGSKWCSQESKLTCHRPSSNIRFRISRVNGGRALKYRNQRESLHRLFGGGILTESLYSRRHVGKHSTYQVARPGRVAHVFDLGLVRFMCSIEPGN